jgi:hypothetical protein
MERPIVTSNWLVTMTGLTAATVNKSLSHLEQLGVVKEVTAKKRNRLFSYAAYVDIMNRGTELPDEWAEAIGDSKNLETRTLRWARNRNRPRRPRK